MENENQSVPERLGITQERSIYLFEKLQGAYDRIVHGETVKSDVLQIVLDITQEPKEVAMLCFFMGELWAEAMQSEQMGLIIEVQEPEDPGFSAN